MSENITFSSRFKVYHLGTLCKSMLNCIFHKDYLIVPTLRVTGVWRLVADQHIVEIHPGEGGDGFGVIRQMSNEALIRGVSDVEHQPLFGRLIILRIQSCRGERSQDELVNL